MRVVICEDNATSSDVLENYVKRWSHRNGCFTEVYIYSSAEQFLLSEEDTDNIDLIFIDIIMGDMTGIDLAHKLRDSGYLGQIVFATDMREYVFEGYNVSALNYLLKPVSYEKCASLLDRVREFMSERRFYICKLQDKSVKIPCEEILYVEMDSHYAKINTLKGQYTIRSTITSVFNELDDNMFVRCHKSFIINIRHVMSVSKKAATLSSGDIIDLGRKYVKDVNDRFVKYNTNRR